MNCIFCESKIEEQDTRIIFKSKPICSVCYTNIIPVIYYNSGYGDGGIVPYFFKWCLESSHLRKHRRSLSKKIFDKLLHKYNFKCVNCDSKENLSIDHIKPVSKGGKDDFENLQILCKQCNSRKGNKWNN